MNKNELIDLINSLNIDKNEFYVVSSGALVLRGILPEAGDLDIAVTNEGLEQLKKNFNLVPKENNWFIINDSAEGVCNGSKDTLAYQPEHCEGIYVQNIHEYYTYLLTSEREKDKKRIPLVEAYISKL